MFLTGIAPWVRMITAETTSGGEATQDEATNDQAHESADDKSESQGGDETTTSDNASEDHSDPNAGTDEWAQTFGDTTPAEVAAELEKWKKNSRTWEDRAKKDKKTLDKLNEQLGSLEGRPTVESMEKIIAERDDAVRETVLLRTLLEQGHDAVGLMDSRRFMARVADLDVAADDFADQLAEVVGDMPKPAVNHGVRVRERAPGDKQAQSLWDLVHGKK